jgi:hypothetical protein
MSQTLTLSNSVYAWLQEEAQRRGLSTVEELLEAWKAEGDELRRRREVVDEIKALQEELSAKYGEMPDSVDLIREDRDR